MKKKTGYRLKRRINILTLHKFISLIEYDCILTTFAQTYKIIINMKKHSLDAEELLTDSELYEIKAGEKKGNSNLTLCDDCMICYSCIACTSEIMD